MPTINSITVEDRGADKKTVHVFAGGTDEERQFSIDKIVRGAFRNGHAVIYPDGTKVFRARHPRFNGGRYEWNRDGNRVRADVIEYTIYPDLTEDREVIRSVWINW
jgi:hypothetical protein